MPASLSARRNLRKNLRTEKKYSHTGTRQGLVRELRLMQCYLMPDETALRELSEQVIEKLKRLTDAEFAGLEFPMN